MSASDTTRYFHSVSKAIFFAFLLPLMAIILLVFTLIIRELQLSDFADNEFANLKKTQLYNQHLIKHQQLLQTLNTTTKIDTLKSESRRFNQNLNNLKQVKPEHSQYWQTLNDAHKSAVVAMSEMTLTSTIRNEQLRKTSIVQLTLVSDDLYQLHQAADSSAPYFSQLEWLIDEVNVTLTLFNELTLKTPTTLYVATTKNLATALEEWLLVEPTESVLPQSLKANLIALERVLYTEQDAIQKWLEYLEQSSIIYAKLLVAKQQVALMLIESIEHHNVDVTTRTLLPHILPDNMHTFIEKQGVTNVNNFVYFCVIALVFILLILTGFLWRKVRQRALRESTKFAVAANDYLESTVEKNAIAHQVEPVTEAISGLALLTERINSNSMSQLLVEVCHICFWKFVPNASHIVNNTMLMKLINNENQASTWRQCFTASSIKTLIATAKNVRKYQQAQSCRVNTNSGQAVLVTINVDKLTRSWFGTVSDRSKEALQEQYIQQINNELENTQLLALQKDDFYVSKFRKMLVRTVLQSQLFSVSNLTQSNKVHRQLSRMIQWCDQIELMSVLEQNKKTLKANATLLIDEVMLLQLNNPARHGNSLCDVKYVCDFDVPLTIDVDREMFHASVEAICELMSTDHKHGTITFSYSKTDNNQINSELQCVFSFVSVDKNQQLPTWVEQLKSVGASEKVPTLVRYTQKLLASIQCNTITGQVNKGNTLLHITMPVANQAIATKKASHFSGKYFVYVAGDHDHANNNIARLKSSTQATVISVDSIQNIEHTLSLNKLMMSDITLIIMPVDECSSDNTQAFLATVSKDHHCKVMVINDAANVDVVTMGLYQHWSSHLHPATINHEISQFLDGKASTNLKIPVESFNHHRYQETFVECLIATDNINIALPCACLLKYFGLRFTAVNSSSQASNMWRTGRFLVLISSFDINPFIQFDAGSGIKRSVINLGETVYGNTNDDELASSLWVNDNIGDIYQLNRWRTILQPWVNEIPIISENDVQLCERSEQSEEINQSMNDDVNPSNNNASYEIVEHKTAKTNDVKSEVLPTTLIIEQDTLTKSPALSPAFDLFQYAENQGSIELAVYMLDDYLVDIEQALATFYNALEHKDIERAITNLNHVIRLSEILAATDLLVVSKKLASVLFSAEPDALKVLCEQLSFHVSQLVIFSEAI